MRKVRKETLQGWGILAGAAALFIVLKLTGVTTWGWLWVLSPIWLPFAFALVAALALVPVLLIQVIRHSMKGERNGKT